MAVEMGPLVDVQGPVGNADGEVAERVTSDVDTAGSEAVALHRPKWAIVADDVSDRI
jgi:hypothetical protein